MHKFLNHIIFTHNTVKITIIDIIIALVTFVVTIIFFKVLKTFIKKRFSHQTPENYAKTFTLFNLTKYFAYILVSLIILNSVGIDLNIFLAGSAALFVGIGLGMQQFFMDFISGIMILFDKTLSVEDVIQIEDQVGKIEQINFRTTIMITRDDRVVIIPNHKFLSEYLYNWTKNSDITRFNISVGVAYGSDTSLVKKILMGVAEKHQQIKNQPKPIVFFSDFADSSLNFQLYFFTDNPLYSPKIKSDLRFMIDKAFRENNISIPFPQRDVHFIPQKDKQTPEIKF